VLVQEVLGVSRRDELSLLSGFAKVKQESLFHLQLRTATFYKAALLQEISWFILWKVARSRHCRHVLCVNGILYKKALLRQGFL
jgi:hypothetical protein